MNFVERKRTSFLSKNNFGTNTVENLNVSSVFPASTGYLSFDADLIGKINLCRKKKEKKSVGLLWSSLLVYCVQERGKWTGIVHPALYCTCAAVCSGRNPASVDQTQGQCGWTGILCLQTTRTDGVDRQECNVCVFVWILWGRALLRGCQP